MAASVAYGSPGEPELPSAGGGARRGARRGGGGTSLVDRRPRCDPDGPRRGVGLRPVAAGPGSAGRGRPRSRVDRPARSRTAPPIPCDRRGPAGPRAVVVAGTTTASRTSRTTTTRPPRRPSSRGRGRSPRHRPVPRPWPRSRPAPPCRRRPRTRSGPRRSPALGSVSIQPERHERRALRWPARPVPSGSPSRPSVQSAIRVSSAGQVVGRVRGLVGGLEPARERQPELGRRRRQRVAGGRGRSPPRRSPRRRRRTASCSSAFG